PDQSLSYATTGGLNPSSFSLKDGGEQDYSGLTPGGAYTVEEGSLPLAWENTALDCTSKGPGTSVSTSGGNTGRKATITLGLAGIADCTYTNTFAKQPSTTATTSSPTGGGVVPGT